MSASGSAFSPVLGLPRLEVASFDIRSYPFAVDLENSLNSGRQSLDQFAANTTSSLYSLFQVSGSTSDNLGDAGGMGAEFNRSQDRVIQEIVAFAATSGSGGVTTIDVQVQGTAGAAAFTSIFGPVGGPANAAMRVALSSSLGNYGIARSNGFTSGSNTVWPKGSIMRCLLTTAAGAAGISGQKGLIIQVFWAPSGSYLNSTSAP